MPVLLALGERSDASAAQLMSAFVGGYEAGTRIGIALGAWILGVPSVLAIGVLTFTLSFIPFFGAFFAGAIAVAGMAIWGVPAIKGQALTTPTTQRLVISGLINGVWGLGAAAPSGDSAEGGGHAVGAVNGDSRLDFGVKAGDTMVLIGLGPGIGMPETYQITSALKYVKEGKRIALVTDGRFSGVSTGACLGHVSPEAWAGGPICLTDSRPAPVRQGRAATPAGRTAPRAVRAARAGRAARAP